MNCFSDESDLRKVAHFVRPCVQFSGALSAWFETAFPKGAKVLVVGADLARDLDLLLRGGWDAWGAEPTSTFTEEEGQRSPEDRIRMIQSVLPELDGVKNQEWDGVLCSDILTQISEDHLFDAAFGLRRVLKPGGRLLVSLPIGTSESDGNTLNGLSPERLELLLTRLGFSCIGRGGSSENQGEEEPKWLTLLFVLGTDGQERSIDRIESVLNRDRKFTTYKLALFRALAEIGMTQYNCVSWLPDGRVALPIRIMAEKWLQYYWPIVESEQFIPQMRGCSNTSTRKLAFRPLLRRLSENCRSIGGLPGFLQALNSGKLSPQENEIYEGLLYKLSETIVGKGGPVKHSGGGNSSNPLFDYDSHRACIVMESALWQELCLMGAWVRDATILRWAELTEDISKQEVKAGHVLGLLIQNPLPEKEVTEARDLFTHSGSLSCLWSGQAIKPKDTDIDHAIPFSLWHNNALWNLFPVKSSLNRSKGDKLPTRKLVLARRKEIKESWESCSQAFPERFRSETKVFAGGDMSSDKGWPQDLFSLFAEAVEVTAIQRGAERWEP